jgi:transposase-like protein
MSEKRKYNPELKAEAIKMVNEQGLTQTEVSQRLGIPKGTIGNWARAIPRAAPARPPAKNPTPCSKVKTQGYGKSLRMLVWSEKS